MSFAEIAKKNLQEALIIAFRYPAIFRQWVELMLPYIPTFLSKRGWRGTVNVCNEKGHVLQTFRPADDDGEAGASCKLNLIRSEFYQFRLTGSWFYESVPWVTLFTCLGDHLMARTTKRHEFMELFSDFVSFTTSQSATPPLGDALNEIFEKEKTARKILDNQGDLADSVSEVAKRESALIAQGVRLSIKFDDQKVYRQWVDEALRCIAPFLQKLGLKGKITILDDDSNILHTAAPLNDGAQPEELKEVELFRAEDYAFHLPGSEIDEDRRYWATLTDCFAALLKDHGWEHRPSHHLLASFVNFTMSEEYNPDGAKTVKELLGEE